jgi:cytochrome oxidase Cu insertion factor (SCO1/SenC/PrrC family)
MPGMNSGPNINDPVVVAAFRAALLHQGLVALLIFAVLGAAYAALRAWRPARVGEDGARPDLTATEAPAAAPEPVARLLLIIGFGNLWLFDGILQAQPGMALGLPSQAIEPTAASSPVWVQHVVNWAVTGWSYHPVQAAAAAVWIQVGLGLWLLTAPRGLSVRLAGLVSVGWGLVVWVFGESFGGIFAPGLSWLTGAPGAVLIYVAAGVLIALPEQAWRSPQLGRMAMAGLGMFLIGMAVLQAWPGRGFWQGGSASHPGSLAGMAISMSVTPQPAILSRWVAAFATFDEAHGAAVNLIAVAALTVTGAAFLSCRPRIIRTVLPGFIVVCLADWLLVQDLGFLGGTGTDPNSMIPLILLATAGYLALSRTEAQPRERDAAEAPLRQKVGAASVRAVAALGAAGVIVLGAVPMAVAQARPNADPILAESVAGTSVPTDYPAPWFALTDQDGKTVTLASLHGKIVLLTFLDPVCGTGCPPAGQEFRLASSMLGANASQVELVGISTSLINNSAAVLQAFDWRQDLSRTPNWLLLTGTPAQLEHVWQEYGIVAPGAAAGDTASASDQAYVIDRDGIVRERYSTGDSQQSAAMTSSFAVLLAAAARDVLAHTGRPASG